VLSVLSDIFKVLKVHIKILVVCVCMCDGKWDVLPQKPVCMNAYKIMHLCVLK